MDGSQDFAASRLSFEIAGEGVAVDPATGRLSIDTDRLLAGVAVVVTATNAAGDTVSRLRLTLASEAGTGTAPLLVTAPALAPVATVGTAVVLDTGIWGGVPAPALAVAWLLDGVVIEGATGARYTPAVADEGKALAARVTATNAAGAASAETAAVAVVHAAPTVVATLADVVADAGADPVTVDAAAAFAGEGLTFAVAGPAVIDTATGVVTIAASNLIDGEKIAVTATNSGGSVTTGFAATVRATPPVCVKRPALAGPAVVGTAVTLDPGAWGGVPAPELAFAWLLDGAEVPGATAAAYVPQPADDGRALAARVTATNAGGSVEAVTAAVVVVHAAPTVIAALADLGLFAGDAAAVVEAAAAFEGQALAFAVAGGGASVDAAGRVSVPATAAGSATVTVTATNSGGSAQVSFVATVSVRVVPPVLVLAPVLAGTGRIGEPVTVSAGNWSGVPAPATSVAWLRDGAAIAGAAGTRYTPVAADDGKGLSARVTATNAAGSAETVTAALAVTYAPPVAKGGLVEEIFDLGSGVQTVAAGADFTGENLRFAVSGAGATVDAATGVVSIPTDSAVQATVTVTATNSGGSASSSFGVTVEAEGVPFALEVDDIAIETSVWRPEAQETWFTPVVRFPGLAGETVDAIEWTTSTKTPIPEAEYEVVTKVGRDSYQLSMRDAAKNVPGASPRVDYSVFRLTETARREALRFRWRRTAEGPWSGLSPAVSVPPAVVPQAEVGALPASPRTKEAYESNIVGSQGQQYQRCRTWNLGIIDEAKRGWVITQQDENGPRLAKNGNAGSDGDPVLWGHPRLDGYHGGKSGGLYLNTDDNAGNGLFVGVTGWYNGSNDFGTTEEAIGVYVGDGSLGWAKRVAITRPSGPGPYVSGSYGPKKAFTNGNGTELGYFGNSFDRRGNFVARRPQPPEMQACTVFKATKTLLDADLAHASGVKAVVYADATQSNRAVYTKSGATGSGSWTRTIGLLTDAQRPIYVVEQHGSRATSITYQALFKSTDGGVSFSFVRELEIADYANGAAGIYHIMVAPNGDVMLVGRMGMHLSTDEGATFTRKHAREVSVAHFFGGSSTTVSGARLGDASANGNGGVYATANVRTTAFAKPNGNAGLPANFNVWDMECAPSNQNRLLVCSDAPKAYLSTDGGANWSEVVSEKVTGDEQWRFNFNGKVAGGHSGFLFCPTDERRVIGFTFQTVTQSIDGGASFQGRRAMYFDGMHVKGTGTGPLTGTDPWKRILTVSQDSLAATGLDGLNWVQRCSLSTGDDAFKAALAAAGGGDKPYVSGAAGILLPNNRVICCANRNTAGQSNVMVILYERQPDGKYPNYLIKNLSNKRTRGVSSAWSLKDPDGYAFVGRWGVGNVGATDPAGITFDDHGGHEFIGQMLSGKNQLSYWGDFASGNHSGSALYLSDHDRGLNGQGTAWHTTTGTYRCRCICIDPHTPERVLYVSNQDRNVIREVKRVNGSLVDSTLKDASGNDVNLRTHILADLDSRIPGGATLPKSFSYISQLLSDPNMPGLFYALVGIHGVPNLWMSVDNGLTWKNAAGNLPRTLWFADVHPLTGDVLLDSSMGRHVVPPPAGYPNVVYKGSLSAQLGMFYGLSAKPPAF